MKMCRSLHLKAKQSNKHHHRKNSQFFIFNNPSMVKDQAPYLNLRRSCYLLIFLSFFSSFLFVFWSYFSVGCHRDLDIAVEENQRESNLLSFPSAWNSLRFPSDPPSRFLKIAVFVKKWPSQNHAGGLERHALTLHRDLAKRGHELHVFTSSSTNVTSANNLNFHLSNPTAAGYLDQATIWEQFQVENSNRRPFDVVHTESVGLMHFRARNLVGSHACREAVDGHKTCQHYSFSRCQPRYRVHIFTHSRSAEESSA